MIAIIEGLEYSVSGENAGKVCNRWPARTLSGWLACRPMKRAR